MFIVAKRFHGEYFLHNVIVKGINRICRKGFQAVNIFNEVWPESLCTANYNSQRILSVKAIKLIFHEGVVTRNLNKVNQTTALVIVVRKMLVH